MASSPRFAGANGQTKVFSVAKRSFDALDRRAIFNHYRF